MSEMDDKLATMHGRVEKLSDLPPSNNARCNLEWFRKNLANIQEEDRDQYGPVHLKVTKPWVGKTELWKRITTGKDPWFEKLSEYPIGI